MIIHKKIFRTFLFFLTYGIITIIPLTTLADSAVTLPNPLGNLNMTLTDVVIRGAKYALGFVGLCAVVMFIYGGILMMTSGGKAEQVQKAKDTLVWAIFGLAVILLSYSFLKLVWQVLGVK